MASGMHRSASHAITVGEIASCDPVRLQARVRKGAASPRPARPPLCRLFLRSHGDPARS